MTSTNENTKQFLNEIVKWFGVIGTAFTVFSNLKAVIDFSDFIRDLTDKWRELIAILVNWILGFVNLSVEIPEATLIFAVFSCMAVALSSQKIINGSWSVLFRGIGWANAGVFSASYFVFVVIGAASIDPRMEDETIKYFLISLLASLIMALPVFMKSEPTRHHFQLIIGMCGFVLAFLFGVVVALGVELTNTAIEYVGFAVLSTIVISMYYVSSPVSISIRTFSITILILGLLPINFFSVTLENMGVSG